MCTLLYPDVIVASKVIDSFACVNSILQNVELAAERVYVTVESCLACQKNCKNMGIENVFTGTSAREWDAMDYESYFERLPHFFERESSESPFYKVKLLRMMEYAGASKDDSGVVTAICNGLLNQGTYSPRTLYSLGLFA